MLTISQQQWLLMEDAFTGMTCARVVQHLKDRHHDMIQRLTPEELQAFADRAVRDAQVAGFSAHRDYCCYASLRLLEPGFESRPQVQAILLQSPQADDTRMARILSALEADAAPQVTP
ncbi:hypothetical protein N8H74_28825 [Pseudomonas sp. B2M1-30]|uniref:hypothetical protein n=1 Tax=Pseudomonas TaxID=286 RepID=UPI0021C5FE3F|nr:MULTISPECIES: hypothetical protein [Pseudomonas]MCU0122278.1 hypothetical protein [Pseudomonas sp. B2M1-30]MCU7262612.1 hypothetical protein [Pseudomonas koreensis]